MHVASTGWLYTLPEVRIHAAQNPRRYVWMPIALIVAAATIAALASASELAWLLLPYFAWQFFHFQKQNLGVTALAASSHRVPTLRPMERRSLVVAGLAGIAGLMAEPHLLQLNAHSRIGPVFDLAGIVFLGAVAVGLVQLFRRRPEDRPLGFCAMYLMAFLFSLPVFAFTSPYAAVGGMTVAHGLQYLVLVGLVAAGTRGSRARFLRLGALCNIALIGGAALAAASHLHSSAPLERVIFGAYLGLVMAHFVVDGGLWRLRDPFPRSFLESRIPYLVPGDHTGTGPPVTDRSSSGIE